MPPRISVIIPAFNAGMFIDKSIKSILDQNFRDECEIIVVDDGSFDDTKSIVSTISKRYQQVIYVPDERKKSH